MVITEEARCMQGIQIGPMQSCSLSHRDTAGGFDYNQRHSGLVCSLYCRSSVVTSLSLSQKLHMQKTVMPRNVMRQVKKSARKEIVLRAVGLFAEHSGATQK